MKKAFHSNLKKGFALVAAMAMLVFTLTACGSSKDVTGKYTAVVKFKDMLSASDVKDMTDSDMSFMTDLNMNFVLDINSDKTFDIDIDADALHKEFDDDFKNSLTKLYKDQFTSAGYTEDQFDSLAAQNGYKDFSDMMDEVIADMIDNMDEVLKDAHQTGKWSLKGDTLDLDGEIAEIQSDGSLQMSIDYDGVNVNLHFVK